jgi:hypothetical protein
MPLSGLSQEEVDAKGGFPEGTLFTPKPITWIGSMGSLVFQKARIRPFLDDAGPVKTARQFNRPGHRWLPWHISSAPPDDSREPQQGQEGKERNTLGLCFIGTFTYKGQQASGTLVPDLFFAWCR